MAAIPRTRGLKNDKYSCYINVVMQILARSPGVWKWIQEYQHSSPGPPQDCIKCLVKDTILEMWKPPWTIPFLPEKLLRWIRENNDTFRANEQGDPHELLCFLMEQTEMEVFEHEELEKLTDVDGHMDAGVYSLTQHRLGTYHELNGPTTIDVSARELIRSYISISNSANFDGGNGRICVERCFSKTPEVLMMKVDRLSLDDNVWTKNKSPCGIDREMTIPTRDGETGDEVEVKYQLVGVIEHKGLNPAEGHYVAKVVDNETLFAYSDDKVHEVELTHDDSYLIFYAKACEQLIPEVGFTNSEGIVFEESEIHAVDEHYTFGAAQNEVKQWIKKYAIKVHAEWLQKCRLFVMCLPKMGKSKSFANQYRHFKKGTGLALYTITYKKSAFLNRIREDPIIMENYNVFCKQIGSKLGSERIALSLAVTAIECILLTHLKKEESRFEFIFDTNPACLLTRSILRNWNKAKQLVINSLDNVLSDNPQFCDGFCPADCPNRNQLFHRSLKGMKIMEPPESPATLSLLDLWRFSRNEYNREHHPLRLLLSNSAKHFDRDTKTQIIKMLQDIKLSTATTFNVYMLLIVNNAGLHEPKNLYELYLGKSAKFGVYVGMTNEGRFRKKHLLTKKQGGTSAVSSFLKQTSSVYLVVSRQYSSFNEAELAEAQLIAVFRHAEDLQRKTDAPLRYKLLNRNLPQIPLFDSSIESRMLLEDFLMSGDVPFRFENEDYVADSNGTGILQRFLVNNVVKKPTRRCTFKGSRLYTPNGITDFARRVLPHFSRTNSDKIRCVCRLCSKTFKSQADLYGHLRIHNGRKVPTLRKCGICNKTFPSAQMLKDHLSIHCEKRLLECELCREKFKSASALYRHKRTHNDIRKHKCPYCDKVFLRRIFLTVHLNIHKGIRSLKCPLCPKTFLIISLLRRHIKTHEKPYKCQRCGKSFGRVDSLKKHSVIHSDAKPHQCTFCPSAFKQKHALRDHMQIHMDEKRYRCSICDKTFHRARAIKEHLLTHSETQDYLCHECGKAFKSGQTLRSHLKKHERIRGYEDNSSGETLTTADTFGPQAAGLSQEDQHCRKGYHSVVILNKHLLTHCNGKTYECIVCEKVFPSTAELQEHTKEHVGSQGYKCDLCNVWLKTISSLRRHKLRHAEGKLKHQCQRCRRGFPSEETLSSHLQAHDVPIVYKCDLCDMILKTAETLRKHKMGHADGKLKHQCQRCRRGFASEDILNKHLLSHSNGVTNECIVCEKVFPSSAELQEHTKEHVGPIVYKCDLCDMILKTADTLLLHKKRHADGKLKHQCQRCKRAFASEDILKRHLLTYCNGETYECMLCEEVFPSSADLQEHTKEHVGPRVYKCRLCGMTLKNADTLRTHMRAHAEGKLKHQCKRCGRGFPSEGNLEMHTQEDYCKRITKDGVTNECIVCKKVFPSSVELQEHAKEHVGPRVYKCDLCGISVKRFYSLRMHKKRHADGKLKHQCQRCGRGFPTEGKLSTHLEERTCANKSKLDHKCKHCGKAYRLREYLLRHLRINTCRRGNRGKLKYQCKRCGKCFPTQEALSSHQRKDSCRKIIGGGETYECKICEQVFPSSAGFKEHAKEHVDFQGYKCDLCDRIYKTIGTLRKHKKRHAEGNLKHQCKRCGRGFPSEEALSRHQQEASCRRTIGDGVSHECKVCEEVFPSAEEFKEHAKDHVGPRIYKCDMCDRTLKTAATLLKHKRWHVKDGVPHKCKICEEVLPSLAEFKEHAKDHVDFQGYKCDLCDRIYKTIGTLRKHKKRHAEGKLKHQCKGCGKCFDSEALNTHQQEASCRRTIGDGVPHECKICEEVLPSLAEFKEHAKEHVFTEPRVYKCDVCDMTLKSAKTLKKHKKRHADGKLKHQRQRCRRGFASEQNLEVHQQEASCRRTIGGGVTYECKVCEEVFPSSAEFKEHAEGHVDSQGYKCDLCDMTLKTAETLRRHKKRHAEGKLKHQCQHCRRGFASEQNLEVHQQEASCRRTIGGGVTYECKVCEEVFPSSAEFKEHAEGHVDSQGYKCDLCDMTLKTAETLRRHKKRHAEGNLKHQCKRCGRGFPSEEALSRHQQEASCRRTIGGGVTYECEVREEVFQSSAEFKEHAEGHVDSQGYKCDLCDMTLKTAETLRRHKKRHAEGKLKHQCQHCRRGFASEQNLEVHQQEASCRRTIGGGVTYECKVCEEVFPSSAEFKEHAEGHVDSQGYKCDLCDMTLKTAETLRRHKKRHAEGNLKHQCKRCGRGFPSEEALSRHQQEASCRRTIGGGVTYECEVCEEVFQSPEELKEHTKDHVDSQGYKCDVCDLTLKTAETLSRHKERHAKGKLTRRCQRCAKCFPSEEAFSTHQQEDSCRRTVVVAKPRVYKCNVCGMTLKSAKTLSQHKGRHAEGKLKHQCQRCGRGFPSEGKLSTHLDERTCSKRCKLDHKCKHCGKAYRLREYLLRHLRGKTCGKGNRGGVPYECKVCKKVFLSAEEFKEHAKDHVDAGE